MTKELLMTTKIPREKGYLYYTGTDEKGNITLFRSKMSWKGRKKKEKKKTPEELLMEKALKREKEDEEKFLKELSIKYPSKNKKRKRKKRNKD